MDEQTSEVEIPGYCDLVLLARGTETVVYKGRREPGAEPVTIKVLTDASPATDERTAFLDEARRLKELSGPCFQRVVEFGEVGGRPYIVFEYVHGTTLEEWFNPQEPCAFGEIAEIVAHVADALAVAHRTVIHRDIKPSNVIVRDDRSVVLIDFGVGLSTSEAREIVVGSGLKGTIRYVSPEQAAGRAHRIDGRTDIWSLGVVLYELLSGQLPFCDRPLTKVLGEEDLREKYAGQMYAEPPQPVRQLNAKIPAELASVCHKCLQKEPDHRYSTAADMATDLRVWLSLARRRQRLIRSAARAAVLIVSLAALISLIWFVWVHFPHRKPTMNARTSEAWRQGTLTPRPSSEKIERWSLRAILPASGVTSVAWSPDGRYLAYGTFAGRIHVCEAKELRTIRVLDGHVGAICAIAWCPDGRLLASASDDGTVRLWSPDAATRHELVHDSAVMSLAWCPDGSELATLDTGGIVSRWTKNGQLAGKNKIQDYYGSWICWSPDGTRLATSGGDRIVRITERSGQPVETLVGHTSGIYSIAWHDNGMLASGGGKDLRIWDAKGKCCNTGCAEGAISQIAWSPEGQCIAGATSAGLILWDQSGKMIWKRPVSAMSVSWSPDGKQLAMGGDGLFVHARSGTTVWHFPDSVEHSCTSSDWSPRGDAVVSGHWKGGVRVWSISGRLLETFPIDAVVKAVRWNRIDGRIAAADAAGQVHVFASGGHRLVSFDHGAPIGVMKWSPDGNCLGVAGGRTARIWRHETVREITTEAEAISLAWRGDSRQVAVGLADLHGIRLISVDDREVKSFRALRDHAQAIAYSPSENRLVVGAEYGALALWPLDGTPGMELHGHTGSIHDVSWSPDGRWFATACHDKSVRLWHRDGVAGPVLKHAWPVNLVSWSPTGGWLATAGPAGLVQLWSSDGKSTMPLAGHGALVSSLTWSPDGTIVMSSSIDGTLRLNNVRDRLRGWIAIVYGDDKAAVLNATGTVLYGDVSGLVDRFFIRCETVGGGAFYGSLTELKQLAQPATVDDKVPGGR